MCVRGCEKQTKLTSELVNNELALWEPAYDYGTDSVFAIKPPTVPRVDEMIYEDSVLVAKKGPFPLPQESMDLYRNYAKRLYST